MRYFSFRFAKGAARRWKTLVVFALPPAVALAALAWFSTLDGERLVELRQDGILVATEPEEDVVEAAEQAVGFHSLAPTRLPAESMRLDFVDVVHGSARGTEERLLVLGYAGPTASVVIWQSAHPRSPQNPPMVIEGAIANGTVWWSPTIETEHVYFVTTETRFISIQVQGMPPPSRESVVGMIRSMVQPQ